MAITTSAPDTELKPSHQQAVGGLTSVATERDRSAFELLDVHLAPRTKGHMARQGAGAASADDLDQETMVQMWRKAGQYDPAKDAPAAWILRVARNLQIDRLRRQNFHEVALTTEAERVDEIAGGHEGATDPQQ